MEKGLEKEEKRGYYRLHTGFAIRKICNSWEKEL